MFGIGGGELIFALVIALLVFGPKRVIEIGRSLGKMVHEFRKVSSDLTTRISKEIDEQKIDLSDQKKENIPQASLGIKSSLSSDRWKA